jgi:hypothetical protein
MKDLGFNPSDHLVLGYATEADAMRVNELLEPFRTFGFLTNLRVISREEAAQELHSQNQSEKNALILLFFCSDSATTPAVSLLYSKRTLQSLKQDQPFEIIELDKPTHAQEAAHTQESLAAYTMTRQQVQLSLLRAALQATERLTKDTRPVSNPTLVGSNALKITLSDAETEVLVPYGFSGLVTVGRSDSCQIHLNSTYVSRMHGCFRWLAMGFRYRDMSQNGTVLIQRHEEIIVHNDEVILEGSGSLRMGDFLLSFIIVNS